MADNKLFYGDNLDVLRRYVRDESVDLIYLDPPFNSRQDYNVLFAEKDGTRSSSQITAFEDTWEWNLDAERLCWANLGARLPCPGHSGFLTHLPRPEGRGYHLASRGARLGGGFLCPHWLAGNGREAGPQSVTTPPNRGRKRQKESKSMAPLDWSQCSAVESIPGKVSGAWVFKDTRMPVSTVFENLESGATIDEIMEWFDVTREQVVAVLEFAARSLDPPNLPAPESRSVTPVDAHSV